MRKIFLACPYNHVDASVTQDRFIQCNKVAATIIESGNIVFSQVSMSHPINLAFEDKDSAAIGKLWAPVDAVFMGMMEELIILDLPGWDLSAGIKREIEFYKNRGQKVNLWSEVESEFS